jgi:hypothetical protein
MSRCFTAANFDRPFIVRRNALRNQRKIMETREQDEWKYTYLF